MRPTPDSTFEDPQQVIVDLRRQLAACTTERDAALAREAAAAAVLQVINASPGALTPVFDAILEKAHALCGAVQGAMFVFDGEQLRAVATRGMPEAFNSRMRAGYRAADFTLTQALLAGEPFNHIVDLALLDHPVARAAVELAGAHTVLAVALRKGDALLGQIVAARREVRPFTETQIALLEQFAAQAVIAMENARLLTETREALEQQTGTAEILAIINNSPGELTPVFDAMLDRALRLCDGAFGTLFTLEGEFFHQAATCNRRVPIDRPFRPGPKSAGGRLLRGERFVHMADARDDEAYRSGDLSRVRLVDGEGARSYLAVPMRKGKMLLGTITIYRREVRPFTGKQIALLENFAAQAVIAMENARLITETREALAQQTATAEVLGVINASPGNLAPVFDAMLEKAHTLCGAEHGSLGTYDGDYFRAVASRGYPVAVLERLRGGFHGLQNPVTRPLFEGARFVHIPDLGEIDHPIPKAVAALGGFRTALFVPLRKDDKLLGHISASRQEVRAFAEKEIALLENFAVQAVIAMENARLLDELRQRNDEIAGWNRELEDRVAAQLGELERVGKLKRFLAPQLAELIVARGDEAVLETHRRDIVVVFCDLRGFTAFAETAEPEEVLELLREYHGALGPIVSASEGTLGHFSGDGIMVFFNDPVPIADASERAVRMTVEMRAAMADLQQKWRRQGRRVGFGAGIARGYATLGQIGFADRIDYTAIGTVCNLAARLCAEAKDGQILLSQRVAAAVEDAMSLDAIGEVALKGLSQPVAVYSVPLAGAQAALRVIEGGAPTA